jgi:hypothetical protein
MDKEVPKSAHDSLGGPKRQDRSYQLDIDFATNTATAFIPVHCVCGRNNAAQPAAKPGIEETLKERGNRYGAFEDHAETACLLIDDMQLQPNWLDMPAYMQQALRVIADKIARMLNGDAYYIDNWHDIQGYAKLVEDILIKEKQ